MAANLKQGEYEQVEEILNLMESYLVKNFYKKYTIDNGYLERKREYGVIMFFVRFAIILFKAFLHVCFFQKRAKQEALDEK